MYQKTFIFFLGIMSSVAFGQNQISGKILDENGKPLIGCHIHISNQDAATDPEGNYSIQNLSSGQTRLIVSHLGYKVIDKIFLLNADFVFNATMVPEINTLDEIVIVQKNGLEQTVVLEQNIKTETIEKYSNQTLGEVLKEVPGVSLLKTGSNIMKPMINGLHSSRVPIISNQVRLEDQQWGTEHAPNFDINAAGKIRVIKGASGLQYGGDAVGGLVIIEPVSVKKDTLFGKTILNLASNGRGGSISSSIHKGNDKGWSWNALGTFKYMGDRSAPDYVLSNTGNREQNFSGDLKFTGNNYDITGFYSLYNAEIGILSASHIGNVNDLFNSINNKQPSVTDDFTYSIKNPKQQVRHHLAKINYNRYFSDRSSLSVQYAFQLNKRLEFDLRRGNNVDRAALDLELLTHTFNLDYKKELENWKLKSGLNASYQNNFANPLTGVQPLIPTYEKFEGGLYGIAEYELSESIKVESGLRYDFSKIQATKYFLKSRWDERGYSPDFAHFIIGESGNQWLTKPEYTFHNVSASLGFHKQFTNDLNWYASMSLATRNPNPSEFFSDGLHHSSGVIELGDLRLDKEQAFKIGTTIQKKWNGFSLEINPYVNNIQNYMFLRPVGFETTIRGAFPVWEFQQTNARLMGVDIQTNWKINSQWEHQFSLAYVNGMDLGENQALIDMPPLNLNNKIRFHKKEWQDFVFELQQDLVLRQNQFPNNNFSTNIVVDGELSPVLVDISTPPSAYQLWSLYTEVRLKISKKVATTLAFSIQNILNTNYRDYLNRQRFFADEMGRNFQIQLKINY